jgi:hypothetical protein
MTNQEREHVKLRKRGESRARKTRKTRSVCHALDIGKFCLVDNGVARRIVETAPAWPRSTLLPSIIDTGVNVPQVNQACWLSVYSSVARGHRMIPYMQTRTTQRQPRKITCSNGPPCNRLGVTVHTTHKLTSFCNLYGSARQRMTHVACIMVAFTFSPNWFHVPEGNRFRSDSVL